ncbi:L-aspartate oxidase [Desulforhopalus vacuolatus]|uniref:L-aspartate oxidase n=1 Tax=Desulforhopalus vacuolatus TaxID=40414 RepID=UPI0019654E2A|nr:L-aspartate oxidase [Desulforhopalus vacuolatus]MBM9521261.1 L-aspartate oxidase [Desulforhopalus vacuolatus]
MCRYKTQVLVIGSGITGTTCALVLAEAGLKVTLLSSGPELDSGNTALAQGGIVYRGREDKPQLLADDIATAGAHINSQPALDFISTEGPKAVDDILINRAGVPFERDNNGFLLTREGAHSVPRILFCADYTGRAIMDGLTTAVRKQPDIEVLTDRTAIDLLTTYHHSKNLSFRYQLQNQCLGAYVLNNKTNEVETRMADFTVLACGGLGQIFLHTTNSAACIGSGLSMPFRAGARVINSEFVQFHPTALFHHSKRKFLISEAVRGEGGQLVNASRQPFMQNYDPRGDLAPRDIVARSIVEEMLRTGVECVFLDMTQCRVKDLKKRFPTIAAKCQEIGIDIAKDLVPVVPVAHYFCGGILVDTSGQSTLKRLFAGGECSCTGVHGANRLASTSLLEGVLWGRSIAETIVAKINRASFVKEKYLSSIPDWISPGREENEDPALIAQDWMNIKTTMWNYVGITRNANRLQRAFSDLRTLNKALHDFYKKTPISKPIVDLFHGSQAAYIVTIAAMNNHLSQGCHFRTDSDANPENGTSQKSVESICKGKFK